MKRYGFFKKNKYHRRYYHKKHIPIKSIYLYFFGIIILCIMIVITESFLSDHGNHFYINSDTNKTADFREMKLSSETLEAVLEFTNSNQVPISKVLTILMVDQNFDLETLHSKSLKINDFNKIYENIWKNNKDAYSILLKSYEGIWEDLIYFPVPISTVNEKALVSYEDSWMYERTFGGNRGHEGTDIMAKIQKRGYYPIISMTKGVVEQIGWLPQGGYRIGIRGEHGAYFYYAHLSDYAEDFQIGEEIEAGELLGFMGDTGYSEVEGTTGNFDVHLHVGIYINTEDNTSISVNPFWILKYLENSKLYYSY